MQPPFSPDISAPARQIPTTSREESAQSAQPEHVRPRSAHHQCALTPAICESCLRDVTIYDIQEQSRDVPVAQFLRSEVMLDRWKLMLVLLTNEMEDYLRLVRADADALQSTLSTYYETGVAPKRGRRPAVVVDMHVKLQSKRNEITDVQTFLRALRERLTEVKSLGASYYRQHAAERQERSYEQAADPREIGFRQGYVAGIQQFYLNLMELLDDGLDPRYLRDAADIYFTDLTKWRDNIATSPRTMPPFKKWLRAREREAKSQ